MTREEAIKVLLNEWECIDRNDGIHCDRQCEKCDLVMDSAILKDAYNMAIQALEQELCDAISREAVIKDFTQWRDKMAYSIGEDYSGVSVLDKAIRVIKGIPPVTQKCEKCAMNGSGSKYCDNCGQKSGKWIPVGERLPEDGQRVFVTQTVSDRAVVYCTTFPFEKIKAKYITAWMPLPEPYKAERSDKE